MKQQSRDSETVGPAAPAGHGESRFDRFVRLPDQMSATLLLIFPFVFISVRLIFIRSSYIPTVQDRMFGMAFGVFRMSRRDNMFKSSVCLCIHPGLWDLYAVHYLNGKGLRCAPLTCVVHHQPGCTRGTLKWGSRPTFFFFWWCTRNMHKTDSFVHNSRVFKGRWVDSEHTSKQVVHKDTTHTVVLIFCGWQRICKLRFTI